MAKRINSKSKGSSFERNMATEFSELFKDTFKRVPQSGAIVGGLNRLKMHELRSDAQEILAGDLIVPRWFPFSVELKNYGVDTGPNMYTLLENNSAVLDGWIEQSIADATFARKKYLLLFKITRKSSYVCVNYGDFVEKCISKIEDMPPKYIMYNGNIIIDKQLFINSYIWDYFPKEKRSQKPTLSI